MTNLAKNKFFILFLLIFLFLTTAYILNLKGQYQSKTTQSNMQVYTSPLEKISFSYPYSWKAEASEFPLPIETLTADSLTLTSPTGKVKISWLGAITGLGGACDITTKIELNNKGCGQFEVVEKDQLPKIPNLDFVEWLYTEDGINYTPRFALQDANSPYLQTTRGYLFIEVFTFDGKNNYLKYRNGRNSGPYDAVFTGGDIFQRDNKYFPLTTKDNAIKYFSDPEVLQAKQIMMSASY